MSKVLCLGDSCLDIIVPYEKMLEDKDAQITFSCGGANANTASGLGRLNVDTAFAGKAGKDRYGYMMKQELEKDKVNVEHFIIEEDLFSTVILVIVDKDRERHPFLMHRDEPSYLQIYKNDLERIDLSDTKYILTNGMMLFEEPAASNITDFLIKAHDKGIQILLDINYRPEMIGKDARYLNRVIEMADYLLGSIDDDFLTLTGKDDIRSAIDELLNENNTIVARNAKGSTVYTKDKVYHTDSYEVEVADTLGAGDAFNAGFIYGLVHGEDLGVCNDYGCASAALNIMKTGARNTPAEDEFLSFISSHRTF